MSTQVVLLRVNTGSPGPAGFEFVRTTRAGDIYHKIIPKITKEDIDELSALFGNIGVSNKDVALIPAVQEEDAIVALIASFQTVEMGSSGGRKRRTRKSKKSKKSRKSKRRM